MFLYQDGTATVEDGFVPREGKVKGFTREVKAGAAAGCYLRLATGRIEKKADGSYEVEGGLKIQGDTLLERGEGDKKELLLPLGEGTSKVEYLW